MADEEIQYVCSVIPSKEIVAYFKHFPKEFAKILPGFRPSALLKRDVNALLFIHRSRDFIASFLEKVISDWLSQIECYKSEQIEAGDDEEMALLHTLSESFFARNVPLYFKLISDERSEEYLSLLSTAISALKELADSQKFLKKEFEAKTVQITHMNKQLETAQALANKQKERLNECLSENSVLRSSNREIPTLNSSIEAYEQKTLNLLDDVQKQRDIIKTLKSILEEERKNKKQFEARIKSDLQQRLEEKAKSEQRKFSATPKRPCDMEEFADYLGYDLQDRGLESNSTYFSLLKEHLCAILFNSMPIVINRLTGNSIMASVANTLVGQAYVSTLSFSPKISIDAVEKFLSTNERIICLNNFIGNINELEMLPIFEAYQDKIIFLTTEYDRSLTYTSKEFLRYIQYLNVNSIKALSIYRDISEDAESRDEEDYIPTQQNQDSKYTDLLIKIMRELGFPRGLIMQKSASISSERGLCCSLAFDVLPYCTDVLQIFPYNVSDTLVRYAGSTGRCFCKDLLMEWFS
jgi:hypothetical protein